MINPHQLNKRIRKLTNNFHCFKGGGLHRGLQSFSLPFLRALPASPHRDPPHNAGPGRPGLEINQGGFERNINRFSSLPPLLSTTARKPDESLSERFRLLVIDLSQQRLMICSRAFFPVLILRSRHLSGVGMSPATKFRPRRCQCSGPACL